VTLSPAIFGIGWQATQNKIKSGELPAPFGDPSGWLGRQILDYRADMQRLAADKLEAKRAAAKQPQPKNFVGKTKKRKLRPPAPTRQRRRAGA
jgi:hypothetical protein